MRKNKSFTFYLLIAYATIWIIVTILSANYSVFWEDEAYTVWLSKMNSVDMCKTTAGDVHPPLYYLIVQIFVTIFGYNAIVYRMVSVAAYIGIVIIICTYFANRFGELCAFLLVTFASLLSNAYGMKTEVRMYEWVMLFVLCAYISLYEILKKNEIKYYIAFAVATLAAAYSHYYALISVAFLCTCLLLFSILNKQYLKNTIITMSVIIILYLPWFLILIKTFARTSNDYWISNIPGLWECLRYIFKSNYVLECFLVSITFALAIWGMLSGKLDSMEKKWMASGLISIIATAFVGIGVSKLFRPMFLTKYMYVCIVIGWVILALMLDRIKWGKWVCLLITVAVFVMQINVFIDNINTRKHKQIMQDRTMNSLEGDVDGYHIINNTDNGVTYTILMYCFPNSIVDEVDGFDNIDWNSIDLGTVLVSENIINDNELYEMEKLSGHSIKTLVSDGYLGTCTVNIYKVE